MMIIVTGAAGFIGSNVVKILNQSGINNIIAVDDLTDGHKYKNLLNTQIADYIDKDDLMAVLPKLDKVDAIFHQGACSSTTEWNGRFMMSVNYDYSKKLLHYALDEQVPFIYASSAAVYGGSTNFEEAQANLSPRNVYGYSKILFDQYASKYFEQTRAPIVGLRYFNVYGPGEWHKGAMASVAFHFNNQLREHGVVKLFEGIDNYGNGEQRRDFVYVDDIVDVNLWCLEHPAPSGIYNVGTGRSQTFNDVAKAVCAWHGRGEIEYIPFPDHLRGAYQSFTEADISALRAAGYTKPFKSVEAGVRAYLDVLNTGEV